jgi:hypothetical protein
MTFLRSTVGSDGEEDFCSGNRFDATWWNDEKNNYFSKMTQIWIWGQAIAGVDYKMVESSWEDLE